MEEISVIDSQFKDETQNFMEIIQGILAWLETTKELLANTPVKDSERVHLEYELIGFGNKAAVRLIEAIKKTKDLCREFCEKVLATHNRRQASSMKKLDEILADEEHLHQLHTRFQED